MSIEKLLKKSKELRDKAMLNLMKFINKYPGYSVSSDGSIWSVVHNWRGHGPKQIKPILDSHGYFKVRLSINGKRINRKVHTLVCEAFHGEKPTPQHEVCHIDGTRTNNDPLNLRWGTRKENAADRTKHGRCKAAENGKLSAHKLIKKICKRGHPKTKESTWGKSKCRICMNAMRKKTRHETRRLSK